MNDNIVFIILFNVILIILFKYKKYVYPLIFILLISLLLKLIYKKREEYMEGYSNYEIYSYWLDEKKKINDEINVDLFEKIDRMINLLIEKETSEKDLLYGDKQCKGEFVLIDKGEGTCGFNKYDEYKYKITEPGNNCEYIPGQPKFIKKPLCEIGEKCENNQDCYESKCINNICNIEFECNSLQLDNCNTKDKCDIINKEFGGDKYVFKNGKCVDNTCTKETFYNCLDKESCENLDYDYKWDPNAEIKCQKLSREVEVCSQYSCPSGYSISSENKDYKCKNLVPPSEIKDYNAEVLSFDDDGTAYVNECSERVCCVPNYTCGEYYTKKNICKGINKNIYGSTCFSGSLTDDKKPYKLYRKGNLFKEIYYPYMEKESDGKIYYDNNKCNSPLSCTEEECTTQNICTCKNGTAATGAECVTNGSSSCASCNPGYYLDNKKCNNQQPCFLINGCNRLYNTTLYGKGSIWADSPKNKTLNPAGIGMSWYYTKSNGSFSKCIDGDGNSGDYKNAKSKLKDFEFCLSSNSEDGTDNMTKNTNNIDNYKKDNNVGLILTSFNDSEVTIFTPGPTTTTKKPTTTTTKKPTTTTTKKPTTTTKKPTTTPKCTKNSDCASTSPICATNNRCYKKCTPDNWSGPQSCNVPPGVDKTNVWRPKKCAYEKDKDIGNSCSDGDNYNNTYGFRADDNGRNLNSVFCEIGTKIHWHLLSDYQCK